MIRHLSLANKCLLLFGGAIVLAVLAALIAPWFRMSALVEGGQLEVSRNMASMWEKLDTKYQSDPAILTGLAPTPGDPIEYAGVEARRLSVPQAEGMAATDEFIALAVERLKSDPERLDIQQSRLSGQSIEYQYAKAVRKQTGETSTLDGLILVKRRSLPATRLLALNIVFIIEAFVVVIAIAIVVFYQITHRLILSPVRDLKQTAVRVREGNVSIRSDIKTGDEFQDLAESFNLMLSDLQNNQDQLRAINAALDLKLHELARTNDALYEGAKMKGEFLANVSHELRTPLNSIIGFAELMLDNARNEQTTLPQGSELHGPVSKRIRYLENIVTAGRSLLEMINSLLEMAKLEAGKIEVVIEKMNLRDVCEGLIGLISPLAEKKSITLRLDVPETLPLVSTDVKKFQQIIFNFLSNAVKFTDPEERSGRPAEIILRAELLGAGDLPGHGKIQVSVIDSGRGIPEEKLARVFDKFYQVDGSYSREHAGTGLGLAICKELSHLLQGELSAESQIDRGTSFRYTFPLEYDPSRKAESELESRFRAALQGRIPEGPRSYH